MLSARIAVCARSDRTRRTNRTPSVRTTRAGFTLIELLVVIGIIGILMSILLPAMSRARQASQMITSANNQRQIMTLLAIYAKNNRERFPVLSWIPGGLNGTEIIYDGPPVDVFQNQHQYGGIAGLFSLTQMGDEEQHSLPRGDVGSYSAGVYLQQYGNTGRWFAVERPAIMQDYVDEAVELQILQSPSDKFDGGEGLEQEPRREVDDIRDFDDVIWYNISYMYVAGLSTMSRPKLMIIGDDSNYDDTSYSDDDANLAPLGSLRMNAEEHSRGFSSQDTFGKRGGHWTFIDGHVEWFEGRTTGIEELTSNVERFHPGGWDRAQIID
ncbi:MAG: type II secretion system protein [Phycisphaerales bacterium]